MEIERLVVDQHDPVPTNIADRLGLRQRASSSRNLAIRRSQPRDQTVMLLSYRAESRVGLKKMFETSPGLARGQIGGTPWVNIPAGQNPVICSIAPPSR
jgi:hypothetical protein